MKKRDLINWHRSENGIDIRADWVDLTISQAVDVVAELDPDSDREFLRRNFKAMKIAPPLPQKVRGMNGFQFDGHIEILRFADNWYAVLFPNLTFEQAVEVLVAENPAMDIGDVRKNLEMASIQPPEGL